tara:strand:+ start:835 stop:1020 length:186 start_codon:yes stop_codon:yes gene_type:complete
MTYGELLQRLYDLGLKNPAGLENDVTIHCANSDEFYPLDEFVLSVESDIVDDNWPILIIQD